MERSVTVLKEQNHNGTLNNADLLMIQAIETLQETNTYLRSISTTADLTLTFFRKVFPWFVAIMAVIWPSIGKIIDKLPPFAH